MQYLQLMNQKSFVRKMSLIYVLLFGGLIQLTSGFLLGEKAVLIEEGIIIIMIFCLAAKNRKYNRLVGNVKLESGYYNKKKSRCFEILHRGTGKKYFFVLCYQYQKKNHYSILSVHGEGSMKKLQMKLETDILPIAVNCQGEYVILLQEYLVVNEFDKFGLGVDLENGKVTACVCTVRCVIILLFIVMVLI